MILANENNRAVLEQRITRIVQSWIRDLVVDAGEALTDLHLNDFQKAEKVIRDFLKKDEKEIVLIEAQIRLDHHDKSLLRQNTDVITLKHLAEQALAELKNGEKSAAIVLLQKMQMILAEIEKLKWPRI